MNDLSFASASPKAREKLREWSADLPAKCRLTSFRD